MTTQISVYTTKHNTPKEAAIAALALRTAGHKTNTYLKDGQYLVSYNVEQVVLTWAKN